MTDITNRLSKAVFDHLETANLRQEPFSLSRIEEVIAGVMATDRKVPVNVVRHPDYIEAMERKYQSERKRIENRIRDEYSVPMPKNLTAAEMAQELDERKKFLYGLDHAKPETDRTTAWWAGKGLAGLSGLKDGEFVYGGRGGGKSYLQEVFEAGVNAVSAPVTYDLAKDPDAFKKARVGDTVEIKSSRVTTLTSEKMPGIWDYNGIRLGYLSWTRIA